MSTGEEVWDKLEKLDWGKVWSTNSKTEWVLVDADCHWQNGLAETKVKQVSKCLKLAIKDHEDLK